MSATEPYILLRAFVDELARSGMRAACTSPGSRSAPLALTLVREPRLRCYSHIDERCAGFFALGLAKASGLPVAVACTSGTAAAELLPAVIEAREARVPLLILTADRPPELRDNGAGQAIDQLKLYGAAAKWFFEVGVLETATAERLRWIRTLACRAYATALEGRPGTVHLNFTLREPLVTDETLPDDASGRPHGAPFVRRGPLSPRQSRGGESSEEDVALLRAIVHRARRGIVVAGRDERIVGEWSAGEPVAAFAVAAGWPLLADPMSGARRGLGAIAHYDALLRDARFCSSLRPDLVLRVGDLPVSKALRSWLAGLTDAPQVGLDPEAAWQDPASVLSDSLTVDPATVLGALAKEGIPSAEEGWLAQWRRGDELAAEAIQGALGRETLNEPGVSRELGALLPQEATIFVSSSMPVRDIETFWPVREDPPRVLCNRGANGIDGIVSSAFGAAAEEHGPVVLLVGDVALAHDIGGLLAARRLDLELTIVLLDNGGGGIFDFLPVARSALARRGEPSVDAGARVLKAAVGEPAGYAEQDIYTQHIATPTGLDFAYAAQLYGLKHELVADVPSFRTSLERALGGEGSYIIEVRSDRFENKLLHERVWQAVAHAIAR